MSHADDGSVSVASEAAGASNTPGAAQAPRTVESEQDKMVRYLAGLLVARDGISAEEAHRRALEDVIGRAADWRKARKNRGKSKSSKPRKFKVVYKMYGAPLSGGAPGLGKKR